MPGNRVTHNKENITEHANNACQMINAKIAALSDWRGKALALIRQLIHEADPEVVEEVKWQKPTNPAGVPVWSHAGYYALARPIGTKSS